LRIYIHTFIGKNLNKIIFVVFLNIQMYLN